VDLPGGEVALRLTPTQQAALQLAYGVGALIAVVTALVGLDWAAHAPAAPRWPAALPPADPAARALIENYRTLNDVALSRATTLFDLMVVKALLPVFTAIVGFILGSRPREPADS